MIGALMNTRGLTELIVLNLALEKGAISPALFAALVIMALVTTFMAGPLLRLLDPPNEFGAPVEEELEVAKRESHADSPVPVPERSILVAPADRRRARPSCSRWPSRWPQSEPPRELIIARAGAAAAQRRRARRPADREAAAHRRVQRGREGAARPAASAVWRRARWR